MLTLWNQFDDLFANDDRFRWPARSLERSFLPAVDIRESKEAYVLTADVPGLSADELDISVKDGVLTVKGERRLEARSDNERFSRTERVHGLFHRRFALPDSADPDRITATGRNGVLQIVIPKKPETTPRKIQVGTVHDA